MLALALCLVTVACDRVSDSERLLYFGRVIFTVARDSGRLLYFGRVIFFIFFPSTKFLTSLGRFSRNFTTRRGIC